MAFHAGLTLVLVLGGGVFSNPPVDVPVVIEIQPAPQLMTSLKKSAAQKKPARRAAVKPTDVLSNGLTRQQTEDIFFPKTNYADISKQAAQNTENEKQARIDGESLRGRLRNSGLNQVFGEDGNLNWAHNQDVYTRIDSHLQFDSLLAQYNHFGAVLVQFNLDDHGLLLLNSLKVKAADPILKVHVLRAMQAGLSEPANETKDRRDSASTTYEARFDFKRGDPAANFVKQQNFGQPVFVFQRLTGEKPVADSMAGQLADLSLLGNPLLIAEKIEKYNRKKRRENLKFDPFESYRRDPFYLL